MTTFYHLQKIAIFCYPATKIDLADAKTGVFAFGGSSWGISCGWFNPESSARREFRPGTGLDSFRRRMAV